MDFFRTILLSAGIFASLSGIAGADFSAEKAGTKLIFDLTADFLTPELKNWALKFECRDFFAAAGGLSLGGSFSRAKNPEPSLPSPSDSMPAFSSALTAAVPAQGETEKSFSAATGFKTNLGKTAFSAAAFCSEWESAEKLPELCGICTGFSGQSGSAAKTSGLLSYKGSGFLGLATLAPKTSTNWYTSRFCVREELVTNGGIALQGEWKSGKKQAMIFQSGDVSWRPGFVPQFCFTSRGFFRNSFAAVQGMVFVSDRDFCKASGTFVRSLFKAGIGSEFSVPVTEETVFVFGAAAGTDLRIGSSIAAPNLWLYSAQVSAELVQKERNLSLSGKITDISFPDLQNLHELPFYLKASFSETWKLSGWAGKTKAETSAVWNKGTVTLNAGCDFGGGKIGSSGKTFPVVRTDFSMSFKNCDKFIRSHSNADTGTKADFAGLSAQVSVTHNGLQIKAKAALSAKSVFSGDMSLQWKF